jgi:urate oxidase
MKLAAQRYGKSRVRVMKILREDDVHTVKELTARVLLEGAFDRCYTAADNAGVIATDTMKNTIYVLAHEHLGVDNEPFAQRLADHFLDRHAHVSRVTVDLDERVWSRQGGHPHSFAQAQVARPFTRLVAGADGARRHESGLRELVILKSTGSGFEGFLRDDFTTLPDTTERILATSLRATWLWSSSPSDARVATAPTATVPANTAPPASYTRANQAIVDALLVPFMLRYSPSVQATLFEMGTAALEACPQIAQITLAMPNLHCLPIDLARFGRTNRHELFVPTDEPHGDIEATVSR